MIPRKFEPVIFSLVLSGFMSCILSGVSTAALNGLSGPFGWIWMKSWATAWILAFAIVLVVGPLSRRIVRALVRSQ